MTEPTAPCRIRGVFMRMDRLPAVSPECPDPISKLSSLPRHHRPISPIGGCVWLKVGELGLYEFTGCSVGTISVPGAVNPPPMEYSVAPMEYGEGAMEDPGW